MPLERYEAVERFRERLLELITRSGQTRTSFARAVGIDRSTLSQILSAETDRLPRVETLLSIADQENVSVDWLLGRTEEGPVAAAVLEVESGAGSMSDERLARWRAEAAGYKIRYVPSSLPDMLKTDKVIDHEFRANAMATPQQRRHSREEGLHYERRPETDTEVCCPKQVLETFAKGTHIWTGMGKRARTEALAFMADLCEELYPTFRWFLYDGLRRFNVPMTIFGPKRAVLYTGQTYLVFNGAEHIRLLAQHFDNLIREAVVHPPEIATFIRKLRDDVS